MNNVKPENTNNSLIYILTFAIIGREEVNRALIPLNVFQDLYVQVYFSIQQ